MRRRTFLGSIASLVCSPPAPCRVVTFYAWTPQHFAAWRSILDLLDIGAR